MMIVITENIKTGTVTFGLFKARGDFDFGPLGPSFFCCGLDLGPGSNTVKILTGKVAVALCGPYPTEMTSSFSLQQNPPSLIYCVTVGNSQGSYPRTKLYKLMDKLYKFPGEM